MSLIYKNMKKQLKVIFDSSNNSHSSEGINIKSEPILYTNKTNDSAQKMAIDTVNFPLVEDAIIDKNKMLRQITICGDKNKSS